MRIYAIPEIESDGYVILTLIKNPTNGDDNIVYAELEDILYTSFYSIDDMLESSWKPYNGEFETQVCGFFHEKEGRFQENWEDGLDYWKYEIYKEGELIDLKYEEM